MDDKGIIKLYVMRDEQAIEETDASYGTNILRLAMNILKNREDSEECLNDTYMRAWNSIPPTIPQFLHAYLAKICRCLAFDRLDLRKAKKRSMQLVELTHEMEMCIPCQKSEQTFTTLELGEQLTAFLRGISKEARIIFVRRYFYEEAVKDIAKQCEMSDASVRKSLQRTRNKLKKFLEQEGAGL